MAELILLVALAGTVAVVLRTWRRGRRRNQQVVTRMQQDMRRFHDDLHERPSRGRAGRYRGPGQGWG